MTTALDIVTRALKKRRVLGVSQTPTGPEASLGLVALNAMLKTWSGQRTLIYHINQEVLSLGSQASRTIGAGGNFNTTRPNRVLDSFIRVDGQDSTVRVVSTAEYDAITDKSTPGMPEIMAYRASYPLGNLYFWPVATASCSLYLNTWKQLQQFASLATEYALPPEYEEAIVYNLARRLSDFGGMLSNDDILIATETYNTVRSVNAQPRRSICTDIGIMGGGAGGAAGAAEQDLGVLPWP